MIVAVKKKRNWKSLQIFLLILVVGACGAYYYKIDKENKEKIRQENIKKQNLKLQEEQKEQAKKEAEELAITTANAGIYQFETKFLLENLPKLNNNNAQKEYYITDLIEMAIEQGKVLKSLVVNEENFKGVNSKVELADAEVIHQNRIKKEFLNARLS